MTTIRRHTGCLLSKGIIMIIKLLMKFYISVLSSNRPQSCTPKCPTEAKHKQKIDQAEQVTCQNLPVATNIRQISLVLNLKKLIHRPNILQNLI
jgi:hypothetical protein